MGVTHDEGAEVHVSDVGVGVQCVHKGQVDSYTLQNLDKSTHTSGNQTLYTLLHVHTLTPSHIAPSHSPHNHTLTHSYILHPHTLHTITPSHTLAYILHPHTLHTITPSHPHTLTAVVRVAMKHQTRYLDTPVSHKTPPTTHSTAKRKSAIDRTNIG